MHPTTDPPPVNAGDSGLSHPPRPADKKSFYSGRRRPQVDPPDWSGIPPYLQQFKSFVLWQLAYRDAKGSWDKPPCQANGRPAKNDDPQTWIAYTDAKNAFEINQRHSRRVGDKFSGVGFVFWPDTGPEYDLVGLDLDNVLDPGSGELKPWAAELVAKVDALGGHVDVSPSGTGLKMIVRGSWREAKKKKKFDDGSELQVFERGYFTLTGRSLTGKDGVPEAQDLLDSLLPLFAGKKAAASRQPSTRRNAPSDGESHSAMGGVSDETILAKARTDPKFARLYDTTGTAGYAGDSEADAALVWKVAFWVGPDAARIERLLLGSPRARGKWDDRRRESTWIRDEIANALAGLKDYYDWSRVTIRWGGSPDSESPEPPAPSGGRTVLAPADDRPVVYTSVEVHQVSHQVRQHLARVPGVFARGGVLVQEVQEINDGGGRLRPVPADAMPELLSRHVRFVTRVVRGSGDVEERRVQPPLSVCKAVYANPAEPIREVRSVVHHPVVLADGRVLTESGYDAESRTLAFIPPGLRLLVPDNPTAADARRAAEELLDPFGEYPFVDDGDPDPSGKKLQGVHSRAAVAALILTLLGRPAIAGPTPFTLVTKNAPGAGGSLLLQAIGRLVTGRGFEPCTLPSDQAEAGKLFTAFAVEGRAAANFDNLTGEVGGPVLCNVLTATTRTDRLLGGNKTYTGPFGTVLFGSGNNASLGADMPRRVLSVRLLVPDERPEARTFKYQLLDHVDANRYRLLSAALTILKAHALAGRPQAALPNWGMYESFTRVVRQAVVFAGLADPYVPTPDRDDHRKRLLRAVAVGIREMDQAAVGLTAADIVRRVSVAGYQSEAVQNAADALAELTDRLSAVSLGKILAQNQNRNLGGVRIVEAACRGRANMAKWVVQEIAPLPKQMEGTGHLPPASPANTGTIEYPLAGDAGDKKVVRSIPFALWGDESALFALLGRVSKSWADAVRWLNESQEGSYPADAQFFEVLADHRKLIAEWAGSLAGKREGAR